MSLKWAMIGGVIGLIIGWLLSAYIQTQIKIDASEFSLLVWNIFVPLIFGIFGALVGYQHED